MGESSDGGAESIGESEAAEISSVVPQLRIRRMMLDAADHRRLAEFYRRLLDAQYEPGSEPGQEVEPRFIDLVEPATGARLGFQVSENSRRPDWPDHRGVPAQGHLDITVLSGDFDRAIDFAVSLGGCVVSAVERDEGIVVLLDPAGHPFCFLTAAVSDESAGDTGMR
ncbi:VOC family protein [Rhodococcus erythropolis]|uniref:VOC family protein n=1 Tax=Rhodococcus erythropolis TaxID=1833 RepID=UPI00379DA303